MDVILRDPEEVKKKVKHDQLEDEIDEEGDEDTYVTLHLYKCYVVIEKNSIRYIPYIPENFKTICLVIYNDLFLCYFINH